MLDISQWSKLQDEGIQSCAEKRYPQAEIIFDKAVKLVREAIVQTQEHTEEEGISVVTKELKEKLANSLNNLAVSYQLQGKYGLALNQYVESTEIYRKIHGEKSLDFASSLHNLAIVYSARGEYDQAEQLFKRSLEIKKSVLDSTHPDLQALKINMAQMLRKAGKIVEAEKVLGKA